MKYASASHLHIISFLFFFISALFCRLSFFFPFYSPSLLDMLELDVHVYIDGDSADVRWLCYAVPYQLSVISNRHHQRRHELRQVKRGQKRTDRLVDGRAYV